MTVVITQIDFQSPLIKLLLERRGQQMEADLQIWNILDTRLEAMSIEEALFEGQTDAFLLMRRDDHERAVKRPRRRAMPG